MGRMPALSVGPGLTAFATAGFGIGFEAAPLPAAAGWGALCLALMLRALPAIGPSGSASPPASRRAAPPLRTAERRLWPEATPCGVSPSYWNGNQGWRKDGGRKSRPTGGSTLPRSSLATRSRKPRIRRVFPDQGNRWIGWKEEAPHPQGAVHFRAFAWRGKPRIRRRFSNPRNIQSLNPKEAPQPAVFFPESPFKVGEGLQEAPHLQGFTVPAGEAFFSFPVDGLHRFSPVPADEAQPSVGSPTSKDSPLDRAGKERVKVGSPASAKIHPHRGRSAPLHRGSPHP